MSVSTVEHAYSLLVDVHTVWEGAIGDRSDMILGHEAVGVVEGVDELVRDFKPGDKVVVSAITPDWSSLEAQAGFPCIPLACLQGGSSPTSKMVYLASSSM